MVWTAHPVENTVPKKTAPKTMPDNTPVLDAHCEQLLRRLAAIGGFRPGSMVLYCRVQEISEQVSQARLKPDELGTTRNQARSRADRHPEQDADRR